MKDLYKKHHIASALHNINEFMKEVSIAIDEVPAAGTVSPTFPLAEATAAPVDVPTDILYPAEKCGVNIPWIDFGNDIVSKPEWGKMSFATNGPKRQALHQLFAVAKEEGFSVIRFWLFPSLWHNNGVYTPEMIKEAGLSTQALCAAARAEGVTLVPTLLSFDNWSKDKVKEGGVQPYSNNTHSMLLQAVINALAENKEVVDYVDVINEPEWSVHSIPNADPQDNMDATSPQMMSAIMQSVSSMVKGVGLKFGYGSASLKWADSGLLPEVDVKDWHAYEGWSTKYFPPTKIPEGSSAYIGETDVPYADWVDFFEGGRYDKVFLWLETKDYVSPKGADADMLRERLRTFKGA